MLNIFTIRSQYSKPIISRQSIFWNITYVRVLRTKVKENEWILAVSRPHLANAIRHYTPHSFQWHRTRARYLSGLKRIVSHARVYGSHRSLFIRSPGFAIPFRSIGQNAGDGCRLKKVADERYSRKILFKAASWRNDLVCRSTPWW